MLGIRKSGNKNNSDYKHTQIKTYLYDLTGGGGELKRIFHHNTFSKKRRFKVILHNSIPDIACCKSEIAHFEYMYHKMFVMAYVPK